MLDLASRTVGGKQVYIADMIGRLLCCLGFHRWGGPFRYLWVCQRPGCFAERLRKTPTGSGGRI